MLLQDLETGPPAYPTPGFLTMTITRPTGDIAYVVAGGNFVVHFYRDTAPVATVSLGSHTPGKTDVLTATATKSDADGDAVTLNFVWKVNGVIKQTTLASTALTDTFSLPGKVNPGDTVSVEVTPNDPLLAGTTVTDTATVSGPAVLPTVTNVVLSGTTWTPAFLSSLALLGSQNVGGYSIPVGGGSQLLTLPAGNIDQIKVTFSENVTVDQSDLLLTGVNTPSYDVADGTFSYPRPGEHRPCGTIASSRCRAGNGACRSLRQRSVVALRRGRRPAQPAFDRRSGIGRRRQGAGGVRWAV